MTAEKPLRIGRRKKVSVGKVNALDSDGTLRGHAALISLSCDRMSLHTAFASVITCIYRGPLCNQSPYNRGTEGPESVVRDAAKTKESGAKE